MSITYVNRLPSWERGHLLAGVASSTDASTFSSEGEFRDTDRCCWKHKQCTGHIIHPFTSDYGHHKLHLHSVSHWDCDCRVKDCSEKTNSSSSQDVGSACSRDVGSTCLNIIQTPCFAKLIPEEECVERFWYGWCKSYRPVSVAVIHHPIHHECGADDLEEEEEESKPPIPIQVGPTTTTTPTDTGVGKGTITGAPDSAAPITIWRSESPTGKSQGSKVIKKVKKKKEKEKDEEETDEKAKLKKKVKKGKLTKKKSPVKSESSPPDLSRSVSPRELARMSESSPESREDLESEDSYNDPRQEEPSSDDIAESSPRKRDKNMVQAKKLGAKASPVKKVNKRKSPPASNLG
ncbi:protein PROCA1 isoform X4 [Pteronotus mesoamericanus]|uniref:protein PROCA1 isoform X4 n=1 Tax=Pteronotus mesoamericanus TaxID=1884717 RepID=UPI0023EB1DAB|nr:protein PROCA1 isoform X4 [Pteronotus parnellii mesoamericanus]